MMSGCASAPLLGRLKPNCMPFSALNSASPEVRSLRAADEFLGALVVTAPARLEPLAGLGRGVVRLGSRAVDSLEFPIRLHALDDAPALHPSRTHWVGLQH